MNTIDHAAARVIKAELVPEHDRLQVLPRHFGRYMILVEDTVYHFTRRLVPQYTGGYWNFYELPTGGFFMAPDSKPMRLYVEGNGFEAEMSADAIGITVCLFAFSHRSFQYPSSRFAQHYHLLREFACFHPEAELINAAID